MGDCKSLKITEKYWGKFIFYQKTFLENTKYNFGFLKTFTESHCLTFITKYYLQFKRAERAHISTKTLKKTNQTLLKKER